jgi:hypothetical protein
MIFAKYEFTPDKWQELKPLIYIDETYQGCAVHEIGHINENPMYAVDIMWFGEIPDEFSIYEVFPNPVGVHTFAGCEDMYLERFCDFNPLSPYCQISE